MPVWKTIPIEEQPSLTLLDWRIMEVEDEGGTENVSRHFVGVCLENYYEGRVSSAIKEFDKKTLRGTTNSGRVYQLSGQSGRNRDADYVWNAWKNINKIVKETDVTHEATN